MRNICIMLAGAAGAFLLPVYPYAILCTVLLLADFVSAVALRFRLRRRGGRERTVLLSSRGIGRMVVSLARIYAALLIARGADVVFELGFCLRFTGAAVCFQLLLSVLENEASGGGPRWAAWLRAYLVDKASRHIDGLK